MKIKTIVSRYLRNVPTDQIKNLDDGVSEWDIDGIKLYINLYIGQSNLGTRYLITDKGKTLQGINLDIKTFYKIIPLVDRRCSKDGVLSEIASNSGDSQLNSLTRSIERFVDMIHKVKAIVNNAAVAE